MPSSNVLATLHSIAQGLFEVTDKEEIFAENETTFFLKSRDVSIVFTKTGRKITGIILNEGIKTIGKKIE